MVFWLSKGEEAKKKELENIKKSVQASREEQREIPREEREIEEIAARLREIASKKGEEKKALAVRETEIKQFPAQSPVLRAGGGAERDHEKPHYAPLFVKLDKYRSIIKRIKSLEEILHNTIEIMKLNDELERIRDEVIKSLLKNLQEAVKIINFLDRELLRPMPMQEEIPGYGVTADIETLQEHVSHLKEQLQELRRYF